MFKSLVVDHSFETRWTRRELLDLLVSLSGFQKIFENVHEYSKIPGIFPRESIDFQRSRKL